MARIEPRQFILKTGETITVRTALPDDALPVSEFGRREVVESTDFTVTTPEEYDYDEPRQRQVLEDHLASPGHLALLAEHDGRVLGILFFRNHSRKRMAHWGHFGIGVAPEWRRRGVGRALITALLDWAAASELIEKVCLGVFTNNPGAQALYRSLGFVEESRRSRAFKFGPDRYVDDIQMYIWVTPHVPMTPLRGHWLGRPSSSTSPAGQ